MITGGTVRTKFGKEIWIKGNESTLKYIYKLNYLVVWFKVCGGIKNYFCHIW